MMNKGFIRMYASRALARQVFIGVCALTLVFSSFAPAQQVTPQAKRALTHGDYDSWRSIQLQQLSRDGRFLAYALVPGDGDGEVVVRNLATGAEWRHPRGTRPEPPPQVEGAAPGPPTPFAQGGPGGGGQLAFTADSRFLAFTVFPTKDEVKQARKLKKKPEEMPKNSLAVMDMSSGQVAKIERVKRFQVPEEGSGFIAYLLEPKPDAKRDERKPDASAEKEPEQNQARPRGKKKEYGSDLVLRNLADGSERSLADVLEFAFSDDAKSLVYAVSSKQDDTNGVFAVIPGSATPPTALLAGKGQYAKLTWDEDATQLAFLSDRDDPDAKQSKFKLYHWDRKAAVATELVSNATPGFRTGLALSDKGTITFALDGSRVFFGVAPPAEPEKDEDDEVPAEEKVVVDLWNWKDDFIQPMQKVRATQDRNRTYRAVYHFKEKKFVQLGDETMEGVNPTSDGRWALGSDDRRYRRLVGFDMTYSDIYLVNSFDGSRKLQGETAVRAFVVAEWKVRGFL